MNSRSFKNFSPKTFSAVAMALALMAAFTNIGCAKRKELQSEVKTDTYMKKSDLAGQNYHLVRTVEEADSDNTFFAVPGFHYDFGMVKPVITQKYLQFVSIGERDRRSSTPNVVASYEILEHFDIARSKNDYGEQTNKVAEETKRPWNEREYIRVDWSKNTITAAQVTSTLGGRGLNESNVVMVDEPKKTPTALLFFRPCH